MVKAKTRARKQGTKEGDRSMLTCRLAVGEGSGRFMTGGRVFNDMHVLLTWERDHSGVIFGSVKHTWECGRSRTDGCGVSH
jgi:hypothetical protein